MSSVFDYLSIIFYWALIAWLGVRLWQLRWKFILLLLGALSSVIFAAAIYMADEVWRIYLPDFLISVFMAIGLALGLIIGKKAGYSREDLDLMKSLRAEDKEFMELLDRIAGYFTSKIRVINELSLTGADQVGKYLMYQEITVKVKQFDKEVEDFARNYAIRTTGFASRYLKESFSFKAKKEFSDSYNGLKNVFYEALAGLQEPSK